MKAEIMLPKDYVGPIMELCQQRRGEYISMEYLDSSRVMLTYHMPLNEIIYDFFDVLKSRSRGYASFDYSLLGYQESDAGEAGYSGKQGACGCAVLYCA